MLHDFVDGATKTATVLYNAALATTLLLATFGTIVAAYYLVTFLSGILS